MIVETYEIEEDSLVHEAPELIEEEAKQLIESLDLEGQKSLLVEKDNGEEERIPYPEMTAEENEVYKVLFATHTAVEKYSAGIIPVRVLQVIGHARELFDEVKVWHRPTPDPDPILVGTIGNKHYLLARWGEALAQFGELRQQAFHLLRERWISSAKETIAKADEFLRTIDFKVEKALTGAWVSTPFY